MSKLYFRYGAMNCGKSTSLLQVAHNYEEQGMKVILAKSVTDTKGQCAILSRLGVARKVDYLIYPDTDLMADCRAGKFTDAACILVDEVQFLAPAQIDQLYEIAVLHNIPVICFGLRTDFLNHGFPGSSRLLEIAHSIQELKNICKCGAKATCNLRYINSIPVFTGEQVSIDNQNSVVYEAVCSSCYLKYRQQYEADPAAHFSPNEHPSNADPAAHRIK